MKRKITLLSTEMVSAVSIFKWAMAGFHFKKDRKKLINVMKSWEVKLTNKQWTDILSGKIPHKIKGDIVIIEIEVK